MPLVDPCGNLAVPPSSHMQWPIQPHSSLKQHVNAIKIFKHMKYLSGNSAHYVQHTDYIVTQKNMPPNVCLHLHQIITDFWKFFHRHTLWKTCNKVTRLSCGVGIFNDIFITNFPRSALMKNLENWTIFSKDMDKSLVACFFWLTVYNRRMHSQGTHIQGNKKTKTQHIQRQYCNITSLADVKCSTFTAIHGWVLVSDSYCNDKRLSQQSPDRN